MCRSLIYYDSWFWFFLPTPDFPHPLRTLIGFLCLQQKLYGAEIFTLLFCRWRFLSGNVIVVPQWGRGVGYVHSTLRIRVSSRRPNTDPRTRLRFPFSKTWPYPFTSLFPLSLHGPEGPEAGPTSQSRRGEEKPEEPRAPEGPEGTEETG